MIIFSVSEKCFLQLLHYSLFRDSFPLITIVSHGDWQAMYALAKKQTVLGLVYDGIQMLDTDHRPDKPILLDWFAKSIQVERENQILNQRLIEVINRYKEKGLSPVLLKGQGLGQYYPNPLHRQSGDIDLYFFDQYDEANAVAAEFDEVQFHPDTSYHRAFEYKGVEVENHRIYIGFNSKRNQRAWEKVQQLVPLVQNEKLKMGDFEVDVPCPQMNVIYVFLHFMHHFLQVGVGMRQVCDWTCLWYAKHDEIDKDLFLQCVNLLRIRRAMTALTYIVTTYLGLPAEYIPLDATTPQAKKDGELMLRDILDQGNFGHDTEIMRGFKRNHHWHNLKNYYKAFLRQMRLYRFYPSEVRAYPWVWLKSKL